MFRLLGRDSVARLLAGDLTVADFYNSLYVTLLMLALAILGISFTGDMTGYNEVNILIIPIWVASVLWLKFYPRSVAGTLALSKAASAVGLVANVKEGWEKWDVFTKHAAMFGGVFGLTRFLVPIKAYPFMGLVMLSAFITLGLWAWIYGAGTKYKKFTILVVVVALGIALYGTVTGKRLQSGSFVWPWQSAASTQWVVVDEFDCKLGLKSWQQSQGVCQSVAVDKDGRYRLAIKSHKMTLGRERDKTGGGGIEQLVLRPEGIFLAYWSGNPDAVRELRRQAPFNEHVGAIIARAGQAGRWALAFSQEVRAPEFELKKGQVIQASLNLPPRKDWFDDNTGHYSLEIERLE